MTRFHRTNYPAQNPGTESEQRFVDNARSVNILMQFTDAEITSATQRALFDADAFNTGNAQSFLFVAVELRDERGTLAARYVSNSPARSTSAWRCQPWCCSALLMVMSLWPSFIAAPTSGIPRGTCWAAFR